MQESELYLARNIDVGYSSLANATNKTMLG